MENREKHIDRSVKSVLQQAMKDTRVVAIQGARQTGKSTLAKELAFGPKDRYLTLDTTAVRESARTNPADFIRQAPEGTLIIDEIQRVPDLILEIKELVDTAQRPGQFLITGSSDLSDLAGVEESLAGRMERVELMPFSQDELKGAPSSFLEKAFTTGFKPEVKGDVLSRQEYLELALSGGYPEVQKRSNRQRRNVWFDNYVKLLLEQATNESKSSISTQIYMQLLNYLASIGGKEVVIENICNDTNNKRFAVEYMLAELQKLFLITLLPAWSTNLTNRAIKHPKIFLKDSGLASRLMHADSSTTTDLTSSLAGQIFETFIFNELLRMASAQMNSYIFYHYRDSRKREVDLVIENENGKIVLIEIKASSTVTASDFKAINYLQEKHSDKVILGFVVYTGSTFLPFGKRQVALPACCLWN